MKEIIIETKSHLKVTNQGIELNISLVDIEKAREEYFKLMHNCDFEPNPRITTTEQICLGCGETNSFANYDGSAGGSDSSTDAQILINLY